LKNNMKYSQSSFTEDFELMPEFLEFEPDFQFEKEMDTASLGRVKWIQSSLNRILGLRLAVDGIIGPQVRSAVRSFQSKYGLVADGIVGPGTEAALKRVVAVQPGSSIPGSGAGPVNLMNPVNWPAVPTDQRILFVMKLLVNHYGLPVNGACGLVGNLLEESGLIPNRIEGSRAATPMTSENFRGIRTAFSAAEVMNRNRAAGIGPRLAGIGIAQWTRIDRRIGLFQHQFQGRQSGANILFDMNAQVDYLVTELKSKFRQVYNFITSAGVTVDDASDEVVYRFEVPGSVLGTGRRRRHSQRAQSVYLNAHS
jgi:peptidoglycan hydrolase-like protein with peptidoglycan-binding domain